MSISTSSTPTTHPSKRRRLANHSSPSALTKPFKCPLKSSLTGSITSKQDPNHNRPESLLPNLPSHASKDLTLTPDLPALQKHHTHLLLTHRHLRSSLDTARQALQLASGNSSSDPTSLISKWRLASRAAAEEVYRDASDRINGMGGMAGWRRERRQSRRGAGCYEDWGAGVGRGEGREDGDGHGEGLSDQQRMEGMEERKAEGGRYAVDRREGEEVGVESGDDHDDSFTMDMMLASLNIDLDLIGYDKENQQWRE